MGSGDGDREWMRGYEDGKALCLGLGVEAARRRQNVASNPAYEAGMDWAFWDYEDANGLPHADKKTRGA